MKLDPSPRLPADSPSLLRKLTDLFRDTAQQVNDLSDGRINASTSALSSVPTSGTWKKGDFVRNTSPTEAGSAGSKYVVIGWIRITSGSGNVLNTDWVACRCLTGN